MRPIHSVFSMLDLVALGKTFEFEDWAGEKQSSVEKGTGRGCVSCKEIGDLCVFQIVCPFGRCLFFVKTNWRKETKDKESKIVVHTPSPLTICVKTAARRRALVTLLPPSKRYCKKEHVTE